jgi:hypothetical protein
MKSDIDLKRAIAYARQIGSKEAERLIMRIESLRDQIDMAMKDHDQDAFSTITTKICKNIEKLVSIARQGD